MVREFAGSPIDCFHLKEIRASNFCCGAIELPANYPRNFQWNRGVGMDQKGVCGEESEVMDCQEQCNGCTLHRSYRLILEFNGKLNYTC